MGAKMIESSFHYMYEIGITIFHIGSLLCVILPLLLFSLS